MVLLVDVMGHPQHVYWVFTILVFFFSLSTSSLRCYFNPGFFPPCFSMTSPRRGFPFFYFEVSRISASNPYLAFLFVWYTLAPSSLHRGI